MRHASIAVLFWALAVGAAGAEEIDLQTRQKLDAIIAGWRDNQALVKDLCITGSQRMVAKQDSGDTKEQSTANFTYFQLGEKRRVDYSYTPDSDGGTLLKQHEARWAHDGERTLNYVTNTGLASVHPASVFRFQSPLQWLQTYKKTRDWANHIEQIEFYLSRWDAAREKLTIETISEGDRPLLKVIYETSRGGRGQAEWYFDPELGFQVVAVKERIFHADGTPYASYDVRWQVHEAAQAVWLAVGCDYKEERWEKEGQHEIISVVLQAKEVALNTGQVDTSLFSLEGLKVPPGMVVADHTFKPPLNFRFRSAPLSEADLDLALQMVETPPTAEAKPSTDTAPNAPMQVTSTEPESPDASDDNNAAFPVARWFKTAAWITAVAAMAVVTGYFLVGQKERKA